MEIVLSYWPVLVVAAGAAIGYGELRGKVAQLTKDVEAKAPREIVELQYLEIIRRLDKLEHIVDRRSRPREEE